MSERISIHVSSATPDEETVVVDKLPTHCEKCGQRMYFGYGLAGGGFGTYTLCLHCEDTPLFKVPEAANGEAE